VPVSIVKKNRQILLMFSSPIGARSAAVMLAMAPFISTTGAFMHSAARPLHAAFAPSRSMLLRSAKNAASSPAIQHNARFAAPARHFSRIHMKYSTKETGSFPSEVFFKRKCSGFRISAEKTIDRNIEFSSSRTARRFRRGTGWSLFSSSKLIHVFFI
jgi:hypothetical protein